MPFGGRLDPCQGCRSEQETLIHKSSVFIPANSCASERSQKSKSEVEANAGKARLPIWPQSLCNYGFFHAPARIYPAFE